MFDTTANEEKDLKSGCTVICLYLDMIGSTKTTINFPTEKLDRFNRALVGQLAPHLKKLELDKELLKFTGDGWLLFKVLPIVKTKNGFL